MKNYFIVIIIFFLAAGLVLIYLSFEAGRDHLIQLAPPETDFYLHFNFNQHSWAGQRAARYFYQHWPQQLLKKILVGRYLALSYNLNQDIVNRVDELAILTMGPSADGSRPLGDQPVLIYKYKPNFTNFSIISGGAQGQRLLARFLSPTIVVLSADESTLNRLSLKSAPFFGLPEKSLATGFLTVKNRPASSSHASIRLKFYLTAKEETIFLQGRASDFLFAEPPDQQLEDLIKTISFLPTHDYLFVFKNSLGLPLETIVQIIRVKLAAAFPGEVERTLPDGSLISELIFDPLSINLKIKSVNEAEVGSFNLTNPPLNVFYSLNRGSLLLSLSEKALLEYLKGKTLVDPKCSVVDAAETFVWSAEQFGLKYFILTGQNLKSKLAGSGPGERGAVIKGCLHIE